MASEREDEAPPTPHAAEGIRQLEALPARADAARVEGLESLQRLRTAKAAMLAREQARLTAKYGADHPRVQALAQQISVNRLLVAHVGAEAARAQIAPVDADPNAESFYLACGANRCGEVPAPIPGEPGRVRPQLAFRTL